MKLGVFDSGIGGKAIADFLQREFPEATIIRVDDHQNVPYGEKSSTVVRKLTDAAIQPLLDARCDVIILACNTATAAAIEFLRNTYPAQTFIGLEPMVKPACEQTKSQVVAICATPATLASERYRTLKHRFADQTIILEPNCRDWAHMIEHDQIEEAIIIAAIEDVITQGADIIVLACTHYHWIRTLIEKTTADRATILDPSIAISRRIKQLFQL